MLGHVEGLSIETIYCLIGSLLTTNPLSFHKKALLEKQMELVGLIKYNPLTQELPQKQRKLPIFFEIMKTKDKADISKHRQITIIKTNF